MIELALLCDRMDTDKSGALSLEEMLLGCSVGWGGWPIAVSQGWVWKCWDFLGPHPMGRATASTKRRCPNANGAWGYVNERKFYTLMQDMGCLQVFHMVLVLAVTARCLFPPFWFFEGIAMGLFPAGIGYWEGWHSDHVQCPGRQQFWRGTSVVATTHRFIAPMVYGYVSTFGTKPWPKQGSHFGGFRVLNVENDQYRPYSNFEVL